MGQTKNIKASTFFVKAKIIKTLGSHSYLLKQQKDNQAIQVKDNLLLFFGNQNNQSKSNNKQCSQNVKIDHKISDIIHSNYLVKETLKDQQRNDNIKPKIKSITLKIIKSKNKTGRSKPALVSVMDLS